MVLTPQDAELFFKLHRALMFFVNQRLKVIPDDIASPEVFHFGYVHGQMDCQLTTRDGVPAVEWT